MNILDYWTQFQELAKSNPIVAGAVSLWGLSVVTYVARNLPARLWSFVKSRCVASLMITNEDIATNFNTYTRFMDWFRVSKWSTLSRNLRMYGTYDPAYPRGISFGAGEGTHIFFWRRRLFWMSQQVVKGNRTMSVTQYECTIRTLGRSTKPLIELIENYAPVQTDRDSTRVFRWNRNTWEATATTTRRTLDSVIVDQEVKLKLILAITKFLSSRDWYEKRGLSYKLVIVLHGVPGTGKTSLIRALATHFNKGLGVIDRGMVDDFSFLDALIKAGSSMFVLLEDFDDLQAAKIRFSSSINRLGPVPSNLVPATEEPMSNYKASSILTPSGMLNALDGAVCLDGTIVFMTTNILERIDPALLRKGRTDHIIELGLLTDTEIRQYVSLMFPGALVPESHQFDDIAGCDLEALYRENQDDVDSFIAAIPKQMSLRVLSSCK